MKKGDLVLVQLQVMNQSIFKVLVSFLVNNWRHYDETTAGIYRV